MLSFLFTLVCQWYITGTLTYLDVHMCALLETQRQPPAGNINTSFQQCGYAVNLREGKNTIKPKTFDNQQQYFLEWNFSH